MGTGSGAAARTGPPQAAAARWGRLFETRLTRALCLYVGYQRYPLPLRRPADLQAALGVAPAQALQPRLDEILAFAVDRTIGAEIELSALADEAVKAVRRRYPALGRRGRRAVAWYVSHHWR